MLTVIDCGARGGVHRSWESFGSELAYYMFEPEEDEHQNLQLCKLNGNIGLFKTALSDEDGTATLYVYSDPALSSLKPLNEKVYRYRDVELSKEVSVSVSKLSTLCQSEGIKPDFLSIDAQGGTFEILTGCGSFLPQIWGIRAEVEFFEFYKNQKTIFDVGGLLIREGFCLMRLEKCGKPEAGISTDMNQFSVSSDDAKPVWSDAIFFNKRKYEQDLETGTLSENAAFALLFLVHNGCGYAAMDYFVQLPPHYLSDLSGATKNLLFTTLKMYSEFNRRDYNAGECLNIPDSWVDAQKSLSCEVVNSLQNKLETLYGL